MEYKTFKEVKDECGEKFANLYFSLLTIVRALNFGSTTNKIFLSYKHYSDIASAVKDGVFDIVEKENTKV